MDHNNGMAGRPWPAISIYFPPRPIPPPSRGEVGTIRNRGKGGGTKNRVNKYILIILSIVLFFLLSYASGQQEQTESMEAEFYYNRGIAYGKKGQYDRAISDFTKAIEIDPRYAEAYNNRGIAYGKKDQYDQVISDFTKAIEIDPRYAEAYNNRGIAYGKKGQYDRAISDYTKALKINPMFAGAYYNRGVAYYYKKEYDKSLEDVEKAQNLGYQTSPKFLETLRKASGRPN